MENSFYIENKFIANNKSAFIIAEVAQAHDGSLGAAHAYIDLAARAGADAIKFQTHIAKEESTMDESFRINFSYQDKTRFEYWKRMEFSETEWYELAVHARDVGLVFMSTPFSIAAIELLEKINIPVWKVGSGEVGFEPMIAAMIKTKKPIIVSTGLSDMSVTDKLCISLKENKINFAILNCKTAYPSQLEDVGLNMLEIYKQKYLCPVGLSDHTGTVNPAIAAIALGAAVIEVHVVFDKDMFGPDTKASLTEKELKSVTDFRNAFDIMQNNPMDKKNLSKLDYKNKNLFGRSIALRDNLEKGDVILPENILWKKPSGGISPSDIDKILYKKTSQAVQSNRLLQWSDIENQD